MLSLINANTNTVVNDRQDRTNVAGIYQLRFVGLRHSLRHHASRVLGGSAYGPGLKPATKLMLQEAIRALAMMSSAMDSRWTWRSERPFRLPAFACNS